MRPLTGNNGRSGSPPPPPPSSSSSSSPPLPFGHCKTRTGVPDTLDGAVAAAVVTAANANANTKAKANANAHAGLPMEFFLCSEDELDGRSDGDEQGDGDGNGNENENVEKWESGDDSMYGVRSLTDVVGAVFDGGETSGGDRGESNESSLGKNATPISAGDMATASMSDTTAAAAAISPVRRLLRDSLGVFSLPSTPTHFDVSLPTSTGPGSPKSVSVASMRSSADDDDDDINEGASEEENHKGDGNGKAAVLRIRDVEGESDGRGSLEIPQFIMPSMMIPRRKSSIISSKVWHKTIAGKGLITSTTNDGRLFDEFDSSISSIPSWALDFRRSMQNERQRSRFFFDEPNISTKNLDDCDKSTKNDHIARPNPSPGSSWAMISTDLLNNNCLKNPSNDLISYSTGSFENIDRRNPVQNHQCPSRSPFNILSISDQVSQDALYHRQTQHGDDPLGLCTFKDKLIRISTNVLKILGGVGVVGVVVVALANIWASSSSSSRGTSSRSPCCSFSVPDDGELLVYKMGSTGRPFSSFSSYSSSSSPPYTTTTTSTTTTPSSTSGPFPSVYPMQQAGSVEEMSLAELVGAEILRWTGGIGGIWDFLVGGSGR